MDAEPSILISTFIKLARDPSNDMKTAKIDSESSDSEEVQVLKSRSSDFSTVQGKSEKKKIKKRVMRVDSDSEIEFDNTKENEAFDMKRRTDKKKRKIDSSEAESDTNPGNKRRRLIAEEDSEDEVVFVPKQLQRVKRIEQNISSDEEIQVVNDKRLESVKTRKNINHILNEQSLQDETKVAAKEEQERKKRLAERQRLYNEVFIKDSTSLESGTDHLVLDFDPVSKKELVTVHKQLATKLKAHQVKGVKFMWDACFESVERIRKHSGSGCILAHCMGLGKSLQVVTLVHTVLTHTACQVKRVVVVCPVSTLFNWANEFNIWLPGNLKLNIYELASVKTNIQRAAKLKAWFTEGGVLIIGYEMYRNLTNRDNERIDSRLLSSFKRALVDPGPDLVICDEGHLLKNEATALSKAMNRVATHRRIILTGTPLQNSLLEYHCMVQFVKPNLLGTKKEFTNRFVNPIQNGQAADSTDGDVSLMKRRAHVLHRMLESSVQRFDYSVLTPYLPPKHEYVISVKMCDYQVAMYRHYLENCARGGPGNYGRGKGAGLFADYQELSRVWTHPRALLLSQMRHGDNGEEASATNYSNYSGRSTPLSDDGIQCLTPREEKKAWKGRTRGSRGDRPIPQEQLGATVPMSSSWWSDLVQEDDMINMNLSGKLVLLMDIIHQCELIGDKILVFSQSLITLDLIEEFLAAQHLNKGGEHNKFGTWVPNEDYFRLDGKSATELRKECCDAFNDPASLRSRLFLISTKAGGLGINLVAANRVIIFDASWNPSHDVQSIFRIFRFGQKKSCYVYRFLAQGTMEEKIYDRQVTKQSLACRVVDEQQIERHFKWADLNDLYAYDSDSYVRRPTSHLSIKDRLLTELVDRRKEWIATFHEHDSLLENKEEEELNEVERRAAWEDFEKEGKGPAQTDYFLEPSHTQPAVIDIS